MLREYVDRLTLDGLSQAVDEQDEKSPGLLVLLAGGGRDGGADHGVSWDAGPDVEPGAALRGVAASQWQ
jgi:hypothetical protein